MAKFVQAHGHEFYANRALGHIKLKQFDEALEDAEIAIALKPGWPKGHFRKFS